MLMFKETFQNVHIQFLIPENIGTDSKSMFLSLLETTLCWNDQTGRIKAFQFVFRKTKAFSDIKEERVCKFSVVFIVAGRTVKKQCIPMNKVI